MKNVYGEYFNGSKISDYGLEHGRVDYATLAKNIDVVMCNDFMEQTWDIGYWEQISGMIDNSDQIEELEDQIEELEDQIDDPEKRQDIEDQIEKLEDQIEELREEEECYPDVFQWFITDHAGAEVLEWNNEIIYYNKTLDLYLWGVTHWGTSWDYVLTDIKCNTGTF